MQKTKPPRRNMARLHLQDMLTSLRKELSPRFESKNSQNAKVMPGTCLFQQNICLTNVIQVVKKVKELKFYKTTF